MVGTSVRISVEATPERVNVEVIRTVTSDSDEIEEVWPTPSLVLQDGQYDDLSVNVNELTRWR